MGKKMMHLAEAALIAGQQGRAMEDADVGEGEDDVVVAGKGVTLAEVVVNM